MLPLLQSNILLMKTQSGFTLMNAGEFTDWLEKQHVSRIVSLIQNHHTYIPAYRHFNGNNHFERLKAMRDYHVGHNGWNDIAQNLTTFPDGSIATGRSLQTIPVGIKGHNAKGICIEHLGNFDQGEDKMTDAHKNTILLVNAALCKKFRLKPSTDTIVYHHWFDLNSGLRTGGSGVTKSCPGTGFFGGNKDTDARKNFIPLISKHLYELTGHMEEAEEPGRQALFYYHVTASNLRIRTGPGPTYKQAGLVSNGSVLPVFEKKSDWFRIETDNKWVSAKYGLLLGYAKVAAGKLNVRSGPGVGHPVVSSLKQGEEAYIYALQNKWARIALNEQWVHTDYLKLNQNMPES